MGNDITTGNYPNERVLTSARVKPTHFEQDGIATTYIPPSTTALHLAILRRNCDPTTGEFSVSKTNFQGFRFDVLARIQHKDIDLSQLGLYDEHILFAAVTNNDADTFIKLIERNRQLPALRQIPINKTNYFGDNIYQFAAKQLVRTKGIYQKHCLTIVQFIQTTPEFSTLISPDVLQTDRQSTLPKKAEKARHFHGMVCGGACSFFDRPKNHHPHRKHQTTATIMAPMVGSPRG